MVRGYRVKNVGGGTSPYTYEMKFGPYTFGGQEIIDIKMITHNALLVAKINTDGLLYFLLARLHDGQVLNSDVFPQYRNMTVSKMATWYYYARSNTFYQQDPNESAEYLLAISFANNDSIDVHTITLNASINHEIESSFTNAGFTFALRKRVYCDFKITAFYSNIAFTDNKHIVYVNRNNDQIADENTTRKIVILGEDNTNDYKMDVFSYQSSDEYMLSSFDPDNTMPISILYNSDNTINRSIRTFPNTLTVPYSPKKILSFISPNEPTYIYSLQNFIISAVKKCYLIKYLLNDASNAVQNQLLVSSDSFFNSYAMHGNSLSVTCDNGNIIVIQNTLTLSSPILYQTNESIVTNAAVNSVNKYYYGIADGHIVGFFLTTDTVTKYPLNVALDGVRDLCLSPDGQFVIACTATTVYIYTKNLQRIETYDSNFNINKIISYIPAAIQTAAYTVAEMKQNVKIGIVGQNKEFDVIRFYGTSAKLTIDVIYKNTFNFDLRNAYFHQYNKVFLLKESTTDYIEARTLNYNQVPYWSGRSIDLLKVDTNLQIAIEYTLEGVTHTKGAYVKYMHDSYFIDGYKN